MVGLQAQSVGVKTDNNQILIGERFEYELMINLPSPGYNINFKFPDSIPHFEIIENKKFDTINNNGSVTIQKKIIFTSFDSGAWHIPSFEVLLEQNNSSTKLITDSILVNVGYSAADSTNQLRDIKPVMEVTVTDDYWLYVAAIGLVVIILIVLLFFYFKKRKKKPLPVFYSALSPYDEAMKALHELKQYDLEKPEQVKIYYTALADIFKKYYSRKQEKNLMNKTTGDILVSLKKQHENAAFISSIAGALRCTDAVKFAKYIPGVSETGQNQDQVKEAIELIEKEQSQHKP
jgi:hypothetical protein